MYREAIIQVSPEQAYNDEFCVNLAASQLGLNITDFSFRKIKQSIDARRGMIQYRIVYHAYPHNAVPNLVAYQIENLPQVIDAKPVIVVGSGPAGLFAALRLIELGQKPIVLERGKDVQQRRRDLAAINKYDIVNPESNYCFGEGGAGTYSDGKLYTRSKKRGDILRILEILVAHGAHPNILYDAHPHIGTNKLPGIIAAIRNTIISKGGEVHFNTKVTDILIEQQKFVGVTINHFNNIFAHSCILATGHSARDIFELCSKNKITIEAKPFALGIRVEHQQSLIDQSQYKLKERGPYLPAASYSLVTQAKIKGQQKGVFSFCMCPGGFIVPAATAPGEIVVNGMSPSRRDSKYANSGIVVAIDENDWAKYNDFGPLAALQYQKAVEIKASQSVNTSQKAPAQLVNDFVNNKLSKNLLDTSYQPGLKSEMMLEILPYNIGKALQVGFQDFGNKIKGFNSNLGQIIGIESRTSSPVRIPRHKETLEHIHISGLFPCGEGAGYAGGIVSAAMDGERCAEKIFELYKS